MKSDLLRPHFLKPHLISQGKKNPCVIICPGGGYTHQADHEGLPVAKWLNSIGVSAFIAFYRVAPHRYPAPLDDLREAFCHVREHAQEYNVDPHKLGVVGFSAGGHLACLLATEKGNTKRHGEKAWARPDFAVLCYPVISFINHVHEGSMRSLLGSAPDKKLREKLSCENRVNDETPPLFFWHTVADAAVPVENSLLLAEALRKKGIHFAMHLFQSGRHGLGLREEAPEEVRKWPELCASWLRQNKIL
jgi:acetyl esterase/lipase